MIRRICPPHLSRDEYGRILAEKFDAHRAEILAEADLLPKAHVVAWLTKKARENTPVEQLASKAARGAIRPDNLRMLPATFFEADCTYTSGTSRFVCVAVTADPKDGEREAWGWLLRANGTRRLQRMWDDDWPHWTTAEAGDGRG